MKKGMTKKEKAERVRKAQEGRKKKQQLQKENWDIVTSDDGVGKNQDDSWFDSIRERDICGEILQERALEELPLEMKYDMRDDMEVCLRKTIEELIKLFSINIFPL